MEYFDAVPETKQQQEKQSSGKQQGDNKNIVSSAATDESAKRKQQQGTAGNKQSEKVKEGSVTLDSDDSDEDKALPPGAENKTLAESIVSTVENEVRENTKYIKKQLIGKGSYGEAWLCETSESHEKVVAKFMHLPNLSKRARGYAMGEIQCLGKLDHPNVIKLLDSQSLDGDQTIVIVLEFANAGDLNRHIKKRAAHNAYFSENEVMTMFIQLLLAVRHMHRSNMLHRDIKSANVLITNMGLVKMADFGFSRQYEDTVSQAVAGTFCGTPHYLAPELWKNQRYSSRADTWSLGVLLYELFSLRKPFSAKSVRDLMELVLKCQLDPLPSYVSDDARALVTRILTIEPAQRPSCNDILHMPFVLSQCEQLVKNLDKAHAIPDSARIPLQQELRQLIAEGSPPAVASGASPQGDAARPASLHHEGKLRKMKTFSEWVEKYLVLHEQLLILKDSEASQLQPRQLSLEELSSVSLMPTEVTKRANVFAIHTKRSKCTWFEAPSKQEAEQWVTLIQQGMESLVVQQPAQR